MTISEETLMAYADGEVDAATRSSVEAAMQADPEIAGRVARHRAMREAMQGAFSAVIEEPVPERLIAAARGSANAVVDFASARAASNRQATRGTLRRWQPIAIAASLLLGVGIGFLTWHRAGLIETDADGLVAGAALADALSRQLSDERGTGLVAVTGLSFRDKTGGYCRTFSLSGAEMASGLACRDGSRWKIRALAHAARDESGMNFRTAASGMPAAIRAAVEESIDGEPLDHAAEIAARQADWKH
jgi:anti-sigma factor ChrR (cupin superfamily)